MGRHSRWSILEGEAPAEPNLEGEAPAEPFQPTPHQDRTVFATHVGSRGRSPSSVSFGQMHQSVPTILKQSLRGIRSLILWRRTYSRKTPRKRSFVSIRAQRVGIYKKR
ncbi:hypothetical protein HRbin15_02552 [bacterium HR15]|nr:hypothetical protein HRbin15_02552 [bacterium HR15]